MTAAAAATITLTTALSMSGVERDPSQALATARALLGELPDDQNQRVGRCAVLLVTLRQRPDIIKRLLDGGELARWPTLAALADAGATTEELLSLLPGGAA